MMENHYQKKFRNLVNNYKRTDFIVTLRKLRENKEKSKSNGEFVI